jgi:hypothetical protein
MERYLRPSKWPHFMEKKYKAPELIYHSTKILGQLYDMVERVAFIPEWKTPFDKRILDAYLLEEEMLQKARDLKKEYDASMRRIMAQHAISTEFEVWSAFVLDHNQEKKDYTFAEELGQLALAAKDSFRKACIDIVGGNESHKLSPFVAAMYTVTAQEIEKAVEECSQTTDVGGKEVAVRSLESSDMPLMSFPWIFDKELGTIANKAHSDRRNVSVPQQSVQKRFHSRKQAAQSSNDGDNVALKEGVLHRGELLKLFDDADSDVPHYDSAARQQHDTPKVDKVIENTVQPPLQPISRSHEKLLPFPLSPTEDLIKFDHLESSPIVAATQVTPDIADPLSIVLPSSSKDELSGAMPTDNCSRGTPKSTALEDLLELDVGLKLSPSSSLEGDKAAEVSPDGIEDIETQEEETTILVPPRRAMDRLTSILDD